MAGDSLLLTRENRFNEETRMNRDRNLQIKLLRDVNGDLGQDALAGFSEEMLVFNSALLIDEGLVQGTITTDETGTPIEVRIHNLTSKGFSFLETKMPSAADPEIMKIKIFISHSSVDKILAGKLANLLKAAFLMPADKIRCTSVHGFKLRVGSDTDEVLKNEINGAEAFVGLITPASIASTYVLFELGARWGAGLPIFPVMARGANPPLLKGPLGGISALRLSERSDVNSLLEELSMTLMFRLEKASSYTSEIEEVIIAANVVENPVAESLKKSIATPREIGAETFKILQWFFEETEEFKATLPDLIFIHDLKSNVAQFYLDELVGLKLLYASTPPIRKGGRVFSGPTFYSITRQGRALVMREASS